MDSDHKLKFVLFGHCGIGRRSIVTRFVRDTFVGRAYTRYGAWPSGEPCNSLPANSEVVFNTGTEVKTIQIGGKSVELHLW